MAPPREPRTDLPQGTVTLLFTDIEGSTQLLRRLGARYADVQDRQRNLLRAAFARFGGIEVDTQGDAFMVAFRSASEAASAGIEAQRALAAESWPDDVRVPVRMGLHTGEPERGPEGYVGIDVVRASRICAVAHGGQILVSQLTRDLLADAGVETVDLGRHRLKDIPDQERLYQLRAEGLAESFPPPRTLGGASLPALHHRLVGRQADLADIQALLSRTDVRLVTITGAGGAGKSRLALEAAASAALERPVHLVGLAPVSDPALVLVEIARAVGAREQAGRTLAEGIGDVLRGTHTLLFLDNLEHLTAAARDVAALLDLVPDLDVLTTSRAPLRLLGEHVLPLDPLSVDDAATLFVELAAARGVVLREDAQPAVRDICVRLDGLPLAIELVAARLVVLPPVRVLQALDEGMALEMEGPVDLPERQRTLRATIAWSYGLLSPREQELHSALGVFAGGCSLEDARAVARSDTGFFRDIESLVAWSLVRSDITNGDVRLSMLETVREDAVARLAAADRLEDFRCRHAERFLELAAEAESELIGKDQAKWLERLEIEVDNIRAALDWLLSSGRAEDALRAMSALERFWRAHGHLTEARRWLSLGLAIADEVPAEVRARALWTTAHEAMMQSDYPAAVPLLEDALLLFRELGDDRYSVFALCELARALSSQDELDRAERAGREALSIAEEAADERAASAALDTLAMIAGYRGAQTEAQALSERSLSLRRSLGDPLLIAASANTLGLAAMRAGDLVSAEDAFEECLELARYLGEEVLTAAALCALGEIALSRGELDLACARLVNALELYRELGDERACAECIHALGGAAAAEGRATDAARLWGAADALRDRHRAALTPDEKAVEESFSAIVAAELGADELARIRSESRSLDLADLEDLVSQLGSVGSRE